MSTVVIGSGVDTIGDEAFGDCYGLTSMVIPNNVTYIGHRAFNWCNNLVSVTLPESLTQISDSMFNCCRSLTTVNIPASVTEIGSCAFKECESLSSITIPDGVTNISTYAFYKSGLVSVTVPGSVMTLGAYAFSECDAMDSMTFLGSVPPAIACGYAARVPFSYVSSIGVPCGCYNNYFNAWYGNSTTHHVYDHGQDYVWGTVLSGILQESESRIGYTFHALTADENRGTAVVRYNGTWVSSYDYPQSTNCADTTVMAKAQPNYGYHFDHWSNGSIFNLVVLRLVGDSSITAFFAPDQYIVTLRRPNSVYGTVEGGGTFYYLDTATISATANEHYNFHHWSDGNTDNPRQIVVEGNITLSAFFVPDTHHVSVVANNAAYGTTTGTNDYAYGSSATIHANPATGYYFVRWSNGRTSNPLTFTVHSDTTVTAIFSDVVTPELCMVSVQDDHNVLMWDREDKPIVSYTVYREGSVSGTYEAIATVPYSQAGEWTDNDSHPINRSYRYRLTATDTCGNESQPGGIHKTMHLTISQGVDNSWNLVWTAYEGAEYTTYVIYRGTSAADIQQIDVMASDGNTAYSDNTAPTGDVYYQVGVMMTTPCNDAAKTVMVSRSNIASSDNPGTSEGIGDVGDDNLRVYALDGRIVVGNPGNTDGDVRIYDMMGRPVRNEALPTGVYMVKIGILPARKVVVMK